MYEHVDKYHTNALVNEPFKEMYGETFQRQTLPRQELVGKNVERTKLVSYKHCT